MTLVNTEDIRRRSAQTEPRVDEGAPLDTLTLMLAGVADSFPAWGKDTVKRDKDLRVFWPTEPVLASALYTIVIRNAAYSWKLVGPEQTVEAVQDMLHMANIGRGWADFAKQVTQDLLTQDNGAFIEIIRSADDPAAAVLGIAHLDAGRCRRTGNDDVPVIYTDRDGKQHRMRWYQIVPMTELPSPIETMNGVQLCAVSRVLRAAQLLRDISIYQREKVAGDNPNVIHLVSGIKSEAITDAMQSHKDQQAAKGLMRWVVPLVIGTIDPTSVVGHEQIDLKNLPDGFDLDEVMKWYISQLALGFGADYQDFAPLPSGGLGSSTQSLTLHMKSRGKGTASFIQLMEYAFNFHGLIPQNVLFQYDEPDVESDAQVAELNKTRTEALAEAVKTKILDPTAARQIMLDEGMISIETFDRLNPEGDVTPDITAVDDEPVEAKDVHDLQSDFAKAERTALEVEMRDELTKVLAENFEAAKKLIFKPKGLTRTKTPQDLLADQPFWIGFRTSVLDVMLPLARKGGMGAAEFNVGLGLGVDLDLVNAEVLEFTGTYTTDWWTKLEGTTRKNLRAAITTWQDSGLGQRGLPDLVDAIEPMFGKARADRIAATETTRIFDEGNRLAHKSAGVTIEEWQTSEDELVEDICRPLNGERFPIDGGPRPVTDTHIS